MFILKLLSKLFKALNSNASPMQIAWGAVWGMFLGLTPFWNLQQLIIIFLIIIINVNISMVIFSLLIFKAIAFFVDPLLHSIGYWLLVDLEGLHTLWTTLYHAPLVPHTRFYNTLVLGAFVGSLILLEPVLLGVRYGVIQYREKLHDRFQKWKIVKAVKSSGLFSLYTKFKQLGD